MTGLLGCLLLSLHRTHGPATHPYAHYAGHAAARRQRLSVKASHYLRASLGLIIPSSAMCWQALLLAHAIREHVNPHPVEWLKDFAFVVVASTNTNTPYGSRPFVHISTGITFFVSSHFFAEQSEAGCAFARREDQRPFFHHVHASDFQRGLALQPRSSILQCIFC
jgi:hypothetical protein